MVFRGSRFNKLAE